MDWWDRFFFAANGSVAVWALATNEFGIVNTLNLAIALWIITKPFAERR